MNQHDETRFLNNQHEDSLQYNEMVSELDYGLEEIKPFQLDALFYEIEQLILSPLQLAEVSLVA